MLSRMLSAVSHNCHCFFESFSRKAKPDCSNEYWSNDFHAVTDQIRETLFTKQSILLRRRWSVSMLCYISLIGPSTVNLITKLKCILFCIVSILTGYDWAIPFFAAFNHQKRKHFVQIFLILSNLVSSQFLLKICFNLPRRYRSDLLLPNESVKTWTSPSSYRFCKQWQPK